MMQFDVISRLCYFVSPQIYAVTTVLYRTLTFNDCKEAADELKREIKEARADLRTKGMKFDN